MRTRRTVAVAVLVAIAILGTGAVVNAARRIDEGTADRRSDPAFYRIPTPLPAGEPGDLIRSEPIASAPLGTRAWRVVYHSRDLADRDIAVSGIVAVPDTPALLGERTILAWAHPTTGSAARCAPSVGLDPFLGIEGFHELLALGYAVAATDYPGMGVPGDSSYLLGIPESNSVLDAARAARHIRDAQAGSNLLLWGHSQGGQAALFAAERAPTYAPELHLEGVAVAAPAADLNTLMTDDIDSVSGVTIAAYAVPAFEAAYADRYSKESIDAILTPEGAAATPGMASLCLLTENAQLHAIADPLIGRYVTSDPATTQPWQTLLRENSAGGSRISVPVFVGQGLADTLVRPTATEQFVTRLCDQGETVSFHEFRGVTHALAAYASLPELIAWLVDLRLGRTPTTC